PVYIARVSSRASVHEHSLKHEDFRKWHDNCTQGSWLQWTRPSTRTSTKQRYQLNYNSANLRTSISAHVMH
ncbi:hypothetical protein HW555_010325, partial [Spodoptera exigua]